MMTAGRAIFAIPSSSARRAATMREENAWTQFTLEGESTSPTKIQPSIDSQCGRHSTQPAHTRSISTPLTPSPSTPYKTSGTSRAINDRMADEPRNEPASTKPARANRSKDKERARRPGHRRGHEPINPKRQGQKTSKREKRFGLADPLAWDVINRSLSQQHRLSSLILKDKSVVLPTCQRSKGTIDAVSRTSSERKALKRFARELEKYADVAGASYRVPVVTPTTTESKASVHTVQPLVPYKDQFRAAGLAVTSADQSRNSACKPRAKASIQRNESRNQLDRASKARKKLDGPIDSPSTGTSTSTSYTSSGSYVEFSPLIGHMLHGAEPLIPRNKNPKSKACYQARKRLISWFLKKPSSKYGSVHGQNTPVRIQHVKGGQLKSDDGSSARIEHNRLQRRSHKPTMQSIPEVQVPPEPALPTRYVTPKKEPCVALANVRCEQRDQGQHPEQDGWRHPDAIDAKQSLGGIGFQGKRDITRGVLPRPCPEPVETIEEAEATGYQKENNLQTRCPSPMWRKETFGTTGTGRRRPDVTASATHESSIPSLPFAAKLAASTASSIQQALDDVCQRVDSESANTDSLSEQRDIKRERPPVPGRASNNHALPRKPRSTDRFIYVKRNMPQVETVQSIAKPLPPEPLSMAPVEPEVLTERRPPQPIRKAPEVLTGQRGNAVAELSKAEEMLKDLDVFLNDNDDANIKDRDVIQGLQVAIHAAADDLYDGYIRHKTGLRIRRFLADLKSFEDISEFGDSSEQRPRMERDKGKRVDSSGERSSRD
ncbi:hypothetical protein F4861DRAFT_530910 [Xylaria intraflava]|nr:hypothetical protein F4861DRAFT_530910 [Xylaria intraflava]